MRFLAAATLILLPIASTAAAPRPQPPAQPRVQSGDSIAAAKPACDRFATTRRAEGQVLPGPPPRAQRLDQLPPGDLHLAVVRQLDGCNVPVIVRHDVGGSRR